MEELGNKTQHKLYSEKEIKFNENHVRLNVEEIADHREANNIGGNNTFLTFKNHQTYIIATFGSRLKIVQSDTPIYYGGLENSYRNLSNRIIYCDLLDCFFFIFMHKLYRKDMNNQPPYLCLEFKSVANWIDSKIHRKLILFIEWKKIAIVDIAKMRVEQLITYCRSNQIAIFCKFLDESQNKMLSVSKKGHIFLFLFSFKMKKLLALNQDRIKLIHERYEEVIGLAVCKKTQHALVLIGESLLYNSRVMIFGVDGRSLVKKKTLDLGGLGKGIVNAIESAGVFGGHILWIGVESNSSGYVQVYDYDVEKNILRCLEEKKTRHQEQFPIDISRVGKVLYYTGWFGKVMRISLSV